MARAMTTSLICCCFCVVDSIVVATRTALMGTVAAIRCKRERKKMSPMFVRLSSPLYIHARTRLPLLPTPPLHSYAVERRKKKKEKKGRKEGYRGKEGGCSFVRFVVFVRSVSCPLLYCAVALGATTTRRIVIALPFSHHHQQAIAEIATESERERETERQRERNAPARVCVARQQQATLLSSFLACMPILGSSSLSSSSFT